MFSAEEYFLYPTEIHKHFEIKWKGLLPFQDIHYLTRLKPQKWEGRGSALFLVH